MTGELCRRPRSTHIGGLVCVKARGSRDSLPDCRDSQYPRKVSSDLRAFSCDPFENIAGDQALRYTTFAPRLSMGFNVPVAS